MASPVDDAGGKKRKADDIDGGEGGGKRIKALDQEVVNKIAAGEIIVAPVHALKELIENAVDAGATSIEIVVKEGGLKLLQITDNGHGIHKDDMPILCERFTTSKLKKFEDLSEIATYGFRGEALASISHIAHLTVTTRTISSSCAWRGHYLDGKLAPAKPGHPSDLRPIAGRVGTQITVEDLFYNVYSRQRACRSASEEYAKILDVVGRYAVHRANVAFSCKKYADPSTSISTTARSETIDVIRQIHGSAIANELISIHSADKKLGFEATGCVTNANYSVKKSVLLLFINHRAVESTNIKRAIDQLYAQYLPKGGHPFTYLSLEIDPRRVDVNVHPTKREVNFLNEDEIIDVVCADIRTKLAAVDTSRTFTTSTLPRSMTQQMPSNESQSRPSAKQSTTTPVRPLENNMIRTDPNLRKITAMLASAKKHSEGNSTNTSEATGTPYEIHPRPYTECRLTTIKTLRAEVQNALHLKLTEAFAAHIYAGLVDPTRRIVAMQAGVKLFLVDYGLVSHEFFYQLGLCSFGNFGAIKFQASLDIRTLIRFATEDEQQRSKTFSSQGAGGNDQENPIDYTSVPELVTQQLISKREMLQEYFNLGISDDGRLETIPLLLKDYTPSLGKLPRFLMRLGPCVNWTQEQECFETFLRELATYYTPEQLPPYPHNTNPPSHEGSTGDGKDGTLDGGSAAEAKALRDALERTLEHVLFPAFKNRLVATERLLPGVIEVADLKGLYRVFERC